MSGRGCGQGVLRSLRGGTEGRARRGRSPGGSGRGGVAGAAGRVGRREAPFAPGDGPLDLVAHLLAPRMVRSGLRRLRTCTRRSRRRDRRRRTRGAERLGGEVPLAAPEAQLARQTPLDDDPLPGPHARRLGLRFRNLPELVLPAHRVVARDGARRRLGEQRSRSMSGGSGRCASPGSVAATAKRAFQNGIHRSSRNWFAASSVATPSTRISLTNANRERR